MNIECIDFFYLSMPVVEDIGDGSQDALLVRVRAGGMCGWGECEASPLVSIASLVCPKSHSACKNVQDSVLGQRLDSVQDIARIGELVRGNSLDLLQADHTLSGIDIALWDLMGRKLGEPIYRLLGYPCAYPKLPYASQLMGDTPAQTLSKARRVRALGYRAAKFGWGPYGRATASADRDQLAAAREGLGEEGVLLIDAGAIWGDDVERAAQRMAALEEFRVLWLEEPFVTGALDAYRELSRRAVETRLAGGEGCHNYHMAANMINHAGLGYVQIDTGRVGGITTAKRVADLAARKRVTYVNHTFTSHLALSASLQPYAGIEADRICEYPVEAKPLAMRLTAEHLLPDANGEIRLPEKPGLGLTPDLAAISEYLVDAQIVVNGTTIYSTPSLSG